jgi:hypothetical protein
MPPSIGGVTYQRLCSDFAWRDNSVSSFAVGSGLRGQVGVESVDIGRPVELLRDPVHEVMLMNVLQGPAGLAGSIAVSSSGCACSRPHCLWVTAAQRGL